MKRFNVAALAVAMIGTTIALAGCGSSNNGTTGTGTGVSVSGATVTGAITASGGSFGFTDPTAYFSGVTLADQTQGFNSGQNGYLTLNGGSTCAQGSPGCLTGVTQYGSTIMITVAQASSQCPWGLDLCASVSGTVAISSQEVQAAGLAQYGSLPSIIGFGMSLQYSGATVSGGYADVCLTRDSSNNCHGIQLQFIPH